MNESNSTSPDFDALITTDLQLDLGWADIAHDETCKAEYECLCVYLTFREFAELTEMLVDACSPQQAHNVLGCFRALLKTSRFLKKHLAADDVQRRIGLLDAATDFLTEQD